MTTRTLSVELFSTVDGFASGSEAEGYFGMYGPDLEAWINEQLADDHVMVMGRKTYVEMAEIVATVEDQSFARLAELPKIVFSSTLEDKDLTWANTTQCREDAVTKIAELKSQPGDPLRVIGSVSLLHSLMEQGLVDVYRLIVFPQILGATGEVPIHAGLPDLDLELTDTRVLDGRLVVLDYAPKRPAAS